MKRRFPFAGVELALALPALAACGSSTSDALLDPGPGAGGTAGMAVGAGARAAGGGDPGTVVGAGGVAQVGGGAGAAPIAGAGGAPAANGGEHPPDPSIADGGALASGGAAARDAAAHDAAAGPARPGPGFVTCGPEDCRLDAGELCCRSSDVLECRTSTSGCASRMHCDADNDCPGDDVCCLTSSSSVFPIQSTTFTLACASTCGGARVECTGPLDCEAGEICCGDLDSSGFSPPYPYRRVRCRSACAGPSDDEYVFCKTSADCPDPATSCQPSQSRNLPGITVCR